MVENDEKRPSPEALLKLAQAEEVAAGQGKLNIPADRFDFLWVVDFPLLSFDKEQKLMKNIKDLKKKYNEVKVLAGP